MTTTVIIAVVLLWILVLALTRQVGILYERIAPAGALAMNQRVSVGMQAPVVTAKTLSRDEIEIGAPSVEGRSTLLFFLSPTCPVCKTLLPVLKSIARREASWCDIVFASDGEGHSGFIADHALEAFKYIVSEELGLLYGVGKLPYATLVDAGGKVAAFGLVNSREHIESLFEAKERGVESIQEYLANQNLRVENVAMSRSES